MKKYIIGISIILFLIIIFVISHKTYYKYNDWWIIGKNISDVQKKYGTFNKQFNSNTSCYYIYTNDGPIMPDHLPYYYCMEYDENQIIKKVYKSGPLGG